MKLSVVIPAYNEEKRITATLEDANAYLSRQDYEYEIIVVVNGSHDRTYEVVRELENQKLHHATAINLTRGGKGYAVTRGILDKATGDIIV
jgi:dolichyl-phosphate beta-glucosyltransferase